MAKHIQNIAIALVVSLVLCSASPARLDKLRTLQSKTFARQEVAENIPAQTPYPPAGIKPEISFDLPTDAKLKAPDNTYLPPAGEPAQTYGPPAKTYGPPEVSVKDVVEQAANDEPVQREEKPDDFQSDEFQPEEPKAEEEQHKDVDSSQQSEEEQPEDEVAKEYTNEEVLNTPYAERLVLAKKNIRNAEKLRSSKLQIASQPIYIVKNGQLYQLLV